MITLFQLASGNNSLRYIDHRTGEEYMLKDLHLPVFSGDRSLAFAYLGSDIESVCVFWALMKSKHCFAILPPSLNIALKMRLEEIYEPAFIFDRGRSSVSGYTSVMDIDLPYFAREKTETVAIAPDIKILLSFADGTGSSKLVKLSEESLIANSLAVCDYLPIQREDVMPFTLALHHGFGLSIFTSNSVKGGLIVCGGEDFSGIGWLKFFDTYRFSSFNGVPKDFSELDLNEMENLAGPSLIYFTQCGGKLQEDLVTKFATFAISRGLRFYVTYGQPEAFGNMAFLAPEQTLEKPTSIGKPVKDGKFIIDPLTNELCFAGSNVFGGYAFSKEDLASYDLNIFAMTGDVGLVLHSFHYITGKNGRTAYVAGIRISLDEMEQILRDEFDVLVKCMSIQDRQLVVYTEHPGLSRHDFIAAMSTFFKLPPASFHVVYVNEFPMSFEGMLDFANTVENTGLE